MKDKGLKPSEEDKKLIHESADRLWEWAKQVKDERIRMELKEIASHMHYLAEKDETHEI